MTSKFAGLIINLQNAAIKLQEMQASYHNLSSIMSKLVVLLYQCRGQSTPKVHVLSSVQVSTNTSIQQLGLMNWRTDQKYGEITTLSAASGRKTTKMYTNKLTSNEICAT